jgi:hypothetical protein
MLRPFACAVRLGAKQFERDGFDLNRDSKRGRWEYIPTRKPSAQRPTP